MLHYINYYLWKIHIIVKMGGSEFRYTGTEYYMLLYTIIYCSNRNSNSSSGTTTTTE